MPFVLDCSMTMAWIFPDEVTQNSESVRDSLVMDFALVPALWFHEVGNVLCSATRRGRIDRKDWSSIQENLSELPIETDEESHHHVLSSVLPLAFRLGLSVYDASYLELAIRHGLPLATLDRELVTKAQGINIKIIGLDI